MKFNVSRAFALMLSVMLVVVDHSSANIDGAAKILQKFIDSKVGLNENLSDMDLNAGITADQTLIPNTYLVQFDQRVRIENFEQLIIDFLTRTHGLSRSTITMRQTISTSLFSGASFSLNTELPIQAIKSMPNVVSVYPVYSVPAPKVINNQLAGSERSVNPVDLVIDHSMTGVAQVHEQLKNFGKGVRIAVIDDGIDYLHPALGGCFGAQCKVAFGYDLVGDHYSASNPIPVPDNDPLDKCTAVSHGTHVAGIIIANATGISQAGFVPTAPFIGVAPQATLGSYRIFGCAGGSTSSDIITEAIFRAYDDKVDIITMSVGGAGAYTERSDAMAAKLVSDRGVYVTFSQGNDGVQGLQTAGTPAISSGAMAIGSVDNTQTAQFYLTTPAGSKIVYSAGNRFGGWHSIVNSTIVVNDPQATADDGCNGPVKSVAGVVVLYTFHSGDLCGSTVRCDKAAALGATGCLIYNIGPISGSSYIPSGSISLVDGQHIIAITTQNSSAVFTFTNKLTLVPIATAGTPSSFSSFGLTGDLLFKPQISGIGGYVYSTISSFASSTQKLSDAYAVYSGTSMSCPYVAGTLALYLASIGNPAPETVQSTVDKMVRRPSFAEVRNLFQSNAKPVKLYSTSMLATTVQQGAGLVNAFQALTATTIISPGELALNDTVHRHILYKIKVSNVGNSSAVYTVRHHRAALATGAELGDDQLLSTIVYSADYAEVFIWPAHFQLKPGESRTVNLRFEEPRKAQPALLPVFSGFISVSNNADNKVAQIPYAGVVGNYKEARIFVRNSPSGIVSGLLNAAGDFISDGEHLNVTVVGAFPIILATAWSSRIVFIDVISGKNNVLHGFNPSYGLMYDALDGAPFHVYNLPRNGATASGQSYTQYYVVFWNGVVSTVISSENGAFLSSRRLSPGQYKLRFWALKHFGDYTNDDDFDIYETPAFNLVY